MDAGSRRWQYGDPQRKAGAHGHGYWRDGTVRSATCALTI